MESGTISDAVMKALKKHSSDGVIDIKDLSRQCALVADLVQVIFLQATRVLENISRPHALLSMSHKHFMIKGPECLGARDREEKCEACPSRKLCDVVSEWMVEAKK